MNRVSNDNVLNGESSGGDEILTRVNLSRFLQFFVSFLVVSGGQKSPATGGRGRGAWAVSRPMRKRPNPTIGQPAERPMYGTGSKTSMYGSKTPMHDGSRMPHYGGHQTPAYESSRTPGHSGAWDMAILNTPTRWAGRPDFR